MNLLESLKKIKSINCKKKFQISKQTSKFNLVLIYNNITLENSKGENMNIQKQNNVNFGINLNTAGKLRRLDNKSILSQRTVKRFEQIRDSLLNIEPSKQDVTLDFKKNFWSRKAKLIIKTADQTEVIKGVKVSKTENKHIYLNLKDHIEQIKDAVINCAKKQELIDQNKQNQPFSYKGLYKRRLF